MSSTTTLVMVFKDEDGNDCSLTVLNPADDLSLEEVTAVMETIIDNDAILTSAGKHLDTVSNCYYRTVTNTPLTSQEGE